MLVKEFILQVSIVSVWGAKEMVMALSSLGLLDLWMSFFTSIFFLEEASCIVHLLTKANGLEVTPVWKYGRYFFFSFLSAPLNIYVMKY